MQADWGRTIDALHPVREILETWRLETHPEPVGNLNAAPSTCHYR
jgi:hypothetical protein